MITRVPLCYQNKNSIKMGKSMAMKMVKITIKIYKSTEILINLN